jgi:PrtD family type I secretion system ABC transporter
MAHFLFKCLNYFVFAGIFSLFVNTLYLTFPIYMEAIYVRVLASASFSTLYAVTVGAVLALLVLGILEFFRSRILVKAGVQMDKLLGRRVLKDMLKESSRIDTSPYTQGLMDINVLRNYFAGNAIFAFFDVPWIPVYLGVIYLMHPILGYTATGGAVIILMLGLLQSFLTKNDLENINDLKGQERIFIDKSLRNAELLKSMGMMAGTARHWNIINDQEIAIQEKSSKKAQILEAISSSFRAFMQVLIYCVGALLVIKNEVNMGSIIAASIIMGRALAPVQQGIGAWKQTIGAKASYGRLNSLLKGSSEGKLLSVKSIKGAIDVKNVALEIAGETIMDNLVFSLKPGESMGLMGHNGAGKTSLCRMLLGIWAPSAGKILLDEQEVSRLDPESLGSFVGYLPQNVELFTGTVSENIARMGPIDSKKVIHAANMAGAHEVILRFSHGYETDIGEAGVNLSGGQRQRVGLARALYGNPSLIILDEPNSNLDEAGELALADALKRLKEQGTTVIMITHKPALLSSVEKILVLKKGSTPDFGTRDEMFNRALTGDI